MHCNAVGIKIWHERRDFIHCYLLFVIPLKSVPILPFLSRTSHAFQRWKMNLKKDFYKASSNPLAWNFGKREAENQIHVTFFPGVLLFTFLCSNNFHLSQPAFTCSKLTMEILEQGCEICSKLTIKITERRR